MTRLPSSDLSRGVFREAIAVAQPEHSASCTPPPLTAFSQVTETRSYQQLARRRDRERQESQAA